MIRHPVASGKFYPSHFEELEAQIKASFTHRFGPGALPSLRNDKEIKAVIVPHAGYSFSGPCAAWAYKEIAESHFPETYIILGPNHTGMGSTAVSLDDWETPFGIVRTNKKIAELIARKTGISSDRNAHLYEHSIEVQLPFLQFVSRDKLDRLKIVAICMTNDVDFKSFALDLKEALIDYDVGFIVSSDFTHYGPAYRYLPFELEKKRRLYELDNKAIEFIKSKDPDGFLNYIYETGATICGYLPIAVLLNTIKAQKVTLLQYYTSGDIINDYKNAVGYAAISFR